MSGTGAVRCCQAFTASATNSEKCSASNVVSFACFCHFSPVILSSARVLPEVVETYATS